MDRLRPREREISIFNGFSHGEIEKLEKLFTEYGEQSVDHTICVKVAKSFSRSAARAGKPAVKSGQVQNWFHDRLKMPSIKETPLSSHQKEITPPLDVSKDVAVHADAVDRNNVNQIVQAPEAGEKIHDLSELEFEAKSSCDGAWYDVERFLTHRFLSSGDAEVRVRFVGFGPEEDEWVNLKRCVRVRSVPLENWECQTVKVGDIMLCLQEKKEQAIYYDACVLEVQRKMHDIRGCRCIFLIQYEHDKSEEKVRLRRLCRRP